MGKWERGECGKVRAQRPVTSSAQTQRQARRWPRRGRAGYGTFLVLIGVYYAIVEGSRPLDDFLTRLVCLADKIGSGTGLIGLAKENLRRYVNVRKCRVWQPRPPRRVGAPEARAL